MGGLRYWTRRVTDIARTLRGSTAPVLLLAHDPRRLVEAAALDVPAVLSGHTHGGRIVLPVAGAVAARRFPVVAGLAHRENTSIFVQPRRRNRRAPLPAELPARGGGGDAGTTGDAVELGEGGRRNAEGVSLVPLSRSGGTAGPPAATSRRAPSQSPPGRSGAPPRGSAPPAIGGPSAAHPFSVIVCGAICEILDAPDLYSIIAHTGSMSPTLKKSTLKTSFIQKLPEAQKYYRYFAALFPLAVESFDLSSYDLGLSVVTPVSSRELKPSRKLATSAFVILRWDTRGTPSMITQ